MGPISPSPNPDGRGGSWGHLKKSSLKELGAHVRWGMAAA